MVQYVENALKYNRVFRWKSGLERLRTFFDAALGVQSREKADEVDLDEMRERCQEAMDRKLRGWWK